MRATLTCVSPQGHETRVDLASALSPELGDAARVEANAWIKRLRLVPFDGRGMRERFTYRGDSLWWFTELYLHKGRRLDTAVAVTLALDAAREQHAPSRLIVETDDLVVRHTAEAFGRARGLPVEIRGAVTSPGGRGRDSYLIGLTARLSRLRPAHARPSRAARVAAFVHTAFWREADEDDGPEQESYIGPVLAALAGRVGPDGIRYVGVGPRQNFRARRWWDPVAPGSHTRPLVMPIERLSRRRDLRASLALWANRHALARVVTSGEAIRSAATFRGLDLWPVLRAELEGAALLQWPWSARAMDEAAAAIDTLGPDVVVTYAEAGGWGRAIVLEARRRGVRSVGLQHGFIYRHWLNYQHDPDEMAPVGDDRGFPAPDCTALFDGYAAAFLESAGHIPASRLAVTGNPGLDRLTTRIGQVTDEERREIRASLDAGDRPIVVLATKFSEARAHLPGLAQAVKARPEMHLVVKTHPAETPGLYTAPFDGVPNVHVTSATTDLARVLAVAAGIVTVNSTVAIDALSLQIPALVIGLPNNLSPFVSAAVMLGATSSVEIGERLEALLYDEEARGRLAERASRFVREHGMTSDGRAADRTATVILGES
jgi:Capsule polysaccharide biosynthesis protein